MAKQVKFINGEMIEYEIRDLVDFYDPILRKPTKPVDLQNMQPNQIIFYVYSMAMMIDHYQNALGLSANQVGWDLRMCAINFGQQNLILINPEIVEASPPTLNQYEGCVSYPGLFLKVPRSQQIKIKYQAPTGKWIEENYEGLTAICIQHEIDHLDGIVYTDKISKINLEKAKRKIKSNLRKMKKFTVQRDAKVKTIEQPNIENQLAAPSMVQTSMASVPTLLLPEIVIPEELKVTETPKTFVYKTE